MADHINKKSNREQKSFCKGPFVLQLGQYRSMRSESAELILLRKLGTDFVGDSRRSDDKFILPAQGGTVSIGALGLGSQLSNTDSRTTFRNAFRASQS